MRLMGDSNFATEHRRGRIVSRRRADTKEVLDGRFFSNPALLQAVEALRSAKRGSPSWISPTAGAQFDVPFLRRPEDVQAEGQTRVFVMPSWMAATYR
jgi:hypothetical protein